jgi:alpha-N-arabinofuranosidase
VSEKIQDHNSFQQPDKIKAGAFNAFTVAKNEITTTLPPASVVILTLE